MENPGSKEPLSDFSIVRAVLLAFVVVILLFAAFEVAKELWMQNLSMQVLHIVFIIRGLTISLVAASLVGWLVVRATSHLLPQRDWSLHNRPIMTNRIDNFISWFIFMRWLAVITAFILVSIVIWVNRWLPMKVWDPLILAIGALAVLNIVYFLIHRFTDNNRYLLPLQTYADLVVLVVLLHFSGGIENPLTLLFLIHIIIAGIILNRKHLYAITATAIGLLLFLAIAEGTEIISHYTLNIFPHFNIEGTHIHAAHQPLYIISFVGMMVTIFLLTAFFISTIMDRIRYDEHQLEQFADRSLEQRQLIEKALETTDTGLCLCNNKGYPYWTNQIWESWFENESIDKLNVLKKSGETVSVSDTLDSGMARVGEVTLKNKGEDTQDKTRIFQITTAPLFDKDGKADRTVSLATDITDQKEAQEQMIRAGKLAAVGELAGKVAHEVNNPVTILSAKCRLLLSDHSDEMSEKVGQELVKITNAADRVADIAQGLLSYCRTSSPERTEINIADPIRNALSLIERSASRAGISIKNQLPDELPKILGNEDELQQVFMNLFLNALDAMPEGGNLVVSVLDSDNSKIAKSKFLTIEVRDTGAGIPEKIQSRIFEPFFTTKEEGKGTGLGLSICSGIIRSHEGTIDLYSNLQKGTRVIIKLPISKHIKIEYSDD